MDERYIGKSMKRKSLIIFDWDDTLFPTHWIMANNINVSDENDLQKYMIYVRELDATISKILATALIFGKVMIVTNASLYWINLSMRILPNTTRIVRMYINVISARDIYQHTCEMDEWKRNAFSHNIRNYVKWANQIISFGDAKYEYDALISLHKYEHVANTYLKSVKLVRMPSFDILLDQLDVITKNMPYICNHESHLDLELAKLS